MSEEEAKVKIALMHAAIDRLNADLVRLQGIVDKKNGEQDAEMKRVSGNITKVGWAVIAAVIAAVLKQAGIGL